jgi:hypothetical protein
MRTWRIHTTQGTYTIEALSQFDAVWLAALQAQGEGCEKAHVISVQRVVTGQKRDARAGRGNHVRPHPTLSQYDRERSD